MQQISGATKVAGGLDGWIDDEIDNCHRFCFFQCSHCSASTLPLQLRTGTTTHPTPGDLLHFLFWFLGSVAGYSSVSLLAPHHSFLHSTSHYGLETLKTSACWLRSALLHEKTDLSSFTWISCITEKLSPLILFEVISCFISFSFSSYSLLFPFEKNY